MARFEFKLPDIGEGVAEAEIVEWLVDVGDTVKEDQQVAAVMTDKATVELEAPVAGTVAERVGQAGDIVRVGTLLLAIDTDGKTPEHARNDEPIRTKPDTASAPAPPPAPPQPPTPSAEKIPPGVSPQRATSGKVLASPVVRRRARDLGLDLAEVPHEGSRVKNRDLDAFLIAAEGGQQASPAAHGLVDKEIPVVGMRRIIAQKMEEAKSEIPHFTYVEEIDMTEFERLRSELRARSACGSMSMPSLFAAAVCRTLPEFPQFNAHYYKDAGFVRRFGSVHLGIATQSSSGLIVAVVQDADRLDLWQLDEKIAARVEKARNGTIDREDLRGATMTLTSLGKLGGIAATPIIIPPQVCILGPNKIVERPAISGGTVVARKIMNLSISCDHRIIDGYDAASFVQALKLRLEMPALIFLPHQG